MRGAAGRPAVDVVVVSWNVREHLRRCLSAVLDSADAEVRAVVVDNASADGSAEMVAADFAAVSLLRSPKNLGFAAAANRGGAAGSAPLVLFLNPDATVEDTTVSRLATTLSGLPGHAAVAPRLVSAEGTAQHSVHRFPSLWISVLLGLGAQHLLPHGMRARLLLEGSWESDRERDVPWAMGAALLVRREVLDRIGGFDERLFMYAEDLEWCDRAARARLPVRFIPGVSVTHAGNASGAQRYGEERLAAYMGSTLEFLRRRHGRAWTAAFVAINAAATVGRYGGWRLLALVSPGRAEGGLQRWRPYARYYLGRGRVRGFVPLPGAP